MRDLFCFQQFDGRFATGRRSRLLAGAAIVASAFAGLADAAVAQENEPVLAEEAGPAAEEGAILVTGSRIVRDGYNAPTPVSVISAEEIQKEAPANIADFVNTLPSVSGSMTATSNSGSLSNGQSGISALNLRSLGQNRTLVLLNGQRSVGSTATGLVDINTFPQALIERVEVVTGGASSAYGSDAVAGVVNFILDTDYEGLKGEYTYGVTTYGDIPNHKVTLTGGTSFAGGRGHILVSGEYYTQEGQHTIDRDWNDSGYFMINNPAYVPGNGQPERLVASGIGSSNFTPGGLIASGPLRGIYFGQIDPATGLATIGELAYGAVAGQWMIGGDYELTSANHRGSNSLAADEDRISIFGRASYELADFLTVYVQGSFSKFEGLSYYQQTPSTGVVIQRDNAFLPESMQDLMDDNGLTSITIGTSNAGIPAAGGNNTREVQRYVVGGEGDFSVAGIDWSWDGYYQHGRTETEEKLINTWQNARIAAMQDAVFDGSGNIVCRVNTDASTANDLPGCVPLNRIGVGGVTQEALDFLFAIYPLRMQYITQDVVGLDFATSELFSNWAGPVSLAFGGEYRKEAVDGDVDPIQYETTWLYGNYRATVGSYNVKEAYVEAVFPLFESFDLNGAFRITDYSTSGTVKTWKAGMTYQPIPDVRLRGTISRDIRAPNLNELFDPGTARTNSVNVPLSGGGVRADQFIQNLMGSELAGTSLTPEIAKTYGVGVVVTPRFLPGFAFSIDYYNIKLDDAIGNVTAQTTVNLCYEQNIQQFCDNIRFTAGSTTDIEYIDLAPFNFASEKASGIDFEASFRRSIGPGTLSLRSLATYYIEYTTDNGIDAPNDAAGAALPHLTYRLSAGYDFDTGFGMSLIGRGISGSKVDNDFIECASNCPASDPTFRTINDNTIPGALFFDANFNYKFAVKGVATEAFLAIRNVLDKDPPLVANGPDGNNTPAYPQTSRGRFDTFGRVFRLGVRFSY